MVSQEFKERWLACQKGKGHYLSILTHFKKKKNQETSIVKDHNLAFICKESLILLCKFDGDGSSF